MAIFQRSTPRNLSKTSRTLIVMSLTTENTKALHGEHRQGIHVNDLATQVIGVAINVHNALGPGLLESCYKECLHYKLTQSGLFVEKENQCLWYLRK